VCSRAFTLSQDRTKLLLLSHNFSNIIINSTILNEVHYGKECDSNEIDLMQNTIRNQRMKKQYRELWGQEHGYRSPNIPNSDQQYIVSDVTVNVDKANVDTVNKDETESDDVDEDEDEDKYEDVQVKPDDDSTYVAGVSLGDNADLVGE
jgi:hypothetical protein